MMSSSEIENAWSTYAIEDLTYELFSYSLKSQILILRGEDRTRDKWRGGRREKMFPFFSRRCRNLSRGGGEKTAAKGNGDASTDANRKLKDGGDR